MTYPPQQPPQIGSYEDPYAPRPPQGLAIAALIFGLLSLPCCVVPILAIAFGILAIVLGSIAKGRAARGEAGGRDLANAGFICGWIGLVLGVILMIVSIVWYDQLMNLGERLQQQRQQQTTPATAPTPASDPAPEPPPTDPPPTDPPAPH
jgi:hypothetical protein